jgi:hypothetical protein
LGQDGGEQAAELRKGLDGIAVDGEGPQQFGRLQVLELLEATDEVDVQIEILELWQGLKFFGDSSESVVRKVHPDQLLPLMR